MVSAKLRIAGGSARGVPIVEPRGHRLRPTSGLVREAIFNILGDLVEGASVLDLYAGTGALGLEALSRGAAHATFIDAEAAACQAIVQTLGRIGWTSRASVLRGKLPSALSSLGSEFGIVFLDPPYGDETAEETLIGVVSKLEKRATVVYEHGSRYNPPELPGGLRLTERRIYGDSAIAFYEPQEAE